MLGSWIQRNGRDLMFDRDQRSKCCNTPLKAREALESEEGIGGFPYAIVACKKCNKKQWSVE